jgi:two-component system NtrC family sensor kinase
MSKTRYLYLITFLLLFFSPQLLKAEDIILMDNVKIERNFGKSTMILVDPQNKLNINDVLGSKNFTEVTEDVPNLGASSNAYWLKFHVRNQNNDPKVILQLPLPTIDYLDYYLLNGRQEVIQEEHTGDRVKYSNRKFDNPIYTFVFDADPQEVYTILLKLRGGEQLQVPLSLGKSEALVKGVQTYSIIFGIYAGIILVMFVYNLFLFVSTKDKSYLYYILYIFITGLTQANFQGYAFKFLWPDNLWLSTYAVYILSAAAALSALEFMKQFLHTRYYFPKLNQILRYFYFPYIVALLLALAGYLNIGYQIIQITAMIAALYMLVIAYLVYNKGYKPAKFFLIAWSVFLLGVCSFVLKDYNILPYNVYTYNMMPFGSALEVMLLSFALADKINILKKEKEASQEEALRISLENEKLILEQNFELEKKVNARTAELQRTNDALENTLNELKDAQSQLVESEKMAGLGQLTAGIAHEINNPINFVTANIKPLQLDIDDLNEVISKYEKLELSGNINDQVAAIEKFKKQIDLSFVQEEIKGLLSGIDEGAKRTAEIIRSLKNFSRLDESDTKPINLNEGIDSTLVLLRSTYPENLKVIKNYGDIPLVECLPGKINQVFMNIISNGIHAIKNKVVQEAVEHITVTTWREQQEVKVSIKDTGSGMTEETKQKIFEPFFTTKDVGEGTGLGLSIVFRIIESHRGRIDVISNVGAGTEFIITLPVI